MQNAMQPFLFCSKLHPMHPQDLLDYTRAFEKAPWELYDSPHYYFHYLKESLAAQEIGLISNTQELAFKKILAFLELLPPDKKISYYLYPDSHTKEELMGNAWFAQAIYTEFTIHALYTEQDRVIGAHEDTHLLSLPLGLSIGFLQEGLAEHMVGHDWYGNSFRKALNEVLGESDFRISESLLTTHSAWLDTEDKFSRHYYALAALFVEFILKEYGKEKFFLLYKRLSRQNNSEGNSQKYNDIFSLTALEVWNDFLEGIKE